jgi:diguanylate cyclase
MSSNYDYSSSGGLSVDTQTLDLAHAPNLSASTNHLSNARILMIDDEPLMIEVVKAFLEEAGYGEVIGCDDPTQAFNVIAAERPDALLLDLMMPGINGFDVLEKVRATESLRYLPVIVLTAASDAATKLKVLGLGATDFLAKPVDSSELILRLRNTLAFKAYGDYLANYDGVTSLPNRSLFLKQLASGIKMSQRENKSCALLHLNLDRFKLINDNYGNRVGDAVLRGVADRLRDCVRAKDGVGSINNNGEVAPVARINGDEFTVLLQELDQVEAAAAATRRIQRHMSRPFMIDGKEIYVDLSIGIAIYPNDSREPEDLLNKAQAALSQAKASGKNQFAFYAKDLHQRTQSKVSLEQQLRGALERNEFVLHYQPKFDAALKIIGAEALIRWQHPEMGMVSPDRFIPLAEELGLINSIGRWVLTRASAQAVHWFKRGHPIPVAVNVSSVQYEDPNLAPTVKSILKMTGLPPHLLTLELTEGALMRDAQKAIETMAMFKALGVNLSLDDFGTGYSSLAYIQHLSLDELKLDRSFVKNLPDDYSSIAIVRSVISLVKGLNLSMVAEGVETQEQLDFLSAEGCDCFQGFFFSKPVPSDQWNGLLGINQGGS